MIPGFADRDEHHGALDEVAFGFTVTGHAPDTFAVLRMRVVEPLGDLYEGTFELVTHELSLAPEALLEQPATATLTRGPRVKTFHGVVRRVEDLGVRDVTTGPLPSIKRVLRVALVPRLWLLSQRVDSRIFQGLTAREIFDDVIRRSGAYDVATFDASQLIAVQPALEHVAQYNESDLDFLRRLMQREGFWIRFAQGLDGETLCLHDATRETGLPDVVADEGMRVKVLGAQIATAHEEGIRSVTWHRAVVPTRVVIQDHDLTRPATTIRAQRPTGGDGRREVFRHPGPVRFTDYRAGRYERDTSAVAASVGYAAVEADALVGEGEGNVTGFSAGSDFCLDHAPSRRYVLTQVEHVGEAPELLYASPEARAASDRYHNTFRFLRAERALALPALSPAPVIQGPQTATVVGPAGEQIYTDEHGRVRVRFHWDRHSPDDGHCSAWIRAAQPWGGTGFGAQFIPRVGMEVVVSFLDGDPDRPLVTGCVYPQNHDWPFAPPGLRERSGVRTNTVGGPASAGRFNELSFDDTAGREELFVHASRDLRTTVDNVMDTTVVSAQSLRVGGSRLVTVEGEASLTVAGARRETVGGARALSVAGDDTVRVLGRRRVEVTGDLDRTVTGDSNETVDGMRLAQVKGALVVSVGVSAESGGDAPSDASVTVEGLATLSAQEELIVESRKGISLRSGDSVVEITPEGVRISAKSIELSASESLSLHTEHAGVEVDDDVEVVAEHVNLYSSGAMLELTSEAALKGARVHLQRGSGKPLRYEGPPKSEAVFHFVKNRAGAPHAGLTVKIRYPDGSVNEHTTDGDGYVRIEAAPNALYEVVEVVEPNLIFQGQRKRRT